MKDHTHIVCFHLYEMSTESRLVLARVREGWWKGGQEDWGITANRHGISLGSENKCSKIDCGCTALQLH